MARSDEHLERDQHSSERQSRRGFLGTLGKVALAVGAAAAGIRTGVTYALGYCCSSTTIGCPPPPPYTSCNCPTGTTADQLHTFCCFTGGVHEWCIPCVTNGTSNIYCYCYEQVGSSCPSLPSHAVS